jgi:hypothetical protein
MMKMKQAALALVVGGLVILTGCGYNVPSDMVAVHVKSGPTDSKQVVGCVDSASRKHWWSTNDDYPMFPTSEREWDATGQSGSDSKDFTSVTKDKVVMNIPITVRFTLKTDCPTLEKFYTSYARRYGVHFDSDGTYNDAWETLLRKLVADPSDQTLDRIVQQYNWQNVWNDPKTKTDIEQQMNAALQSDNSLMVQTAKGQYFDGISVLVGTPQPQNPDLAAAVASEQTLVAQADAARAQAKADKAKAVAETAVAKAEAAKQRAGIEGYELKGMSPKEAVRAYNEAQLIAQGGNPYQPQYIVGGTVPQEGQ